MIDGDVIFIFHQFPDLNDKTVRRNLIQAGIRDGRKNKDILFGLDISFGEPLPIMQGSNKHSVHPTVESIESNATQLTCIKKVLFKAFNMTIETYTFPLPEHLPDFSKIITKLKDMNYDFSDDCMSDVYDVLSRYANSSYILLSTGRVEEGNRRLTLKKDLARTLKEFQQAIQSFDGELASKMGFDEFWKTDEYRNGTFTEGSIRCQVLTFVRSSPKIYI